VALFGVAHFGANFTKIFFVFLFSIFLIYKNKNFPSSVLFFFSKTVEDFLFICNKFLSTLHKKYKFKHTATVFLFGYSSRKD